MKIENRKHCSKIIFKCVYSAVGPIFNEKVAEKCVNSNFCPPAEVQRKKKKKSRNTSLAKRRCYNLYPNHTLIPVIYQDKVPISCVE